MGRLRKKMIPQLFFSAERELEPPRGFGAQIKVFWCLGTGPVSDTQTILFKIFEKSDLIACACHFRPLYISTPCESDIKLKTNDKVINDVSQYLKQKKYKSMRMYVKYKRGLQLKVFSLLNYLHHHRLIQIQHAENMETPLLGQKAIDEIRDLKFRIKRITVTSVS